ncbi:Phosphoribosyl pyrophosphate synthase-associated protein 2 [Liparis tanakae]|uniref:Phosphoribosyl pyrophosphate synthase-associated protein 2 n=1 Tax=Liparis tanakae TaxID=230148 RepID=A0A4Z2H9A6_9TELE|nr:Phosphoribosyl pyrophosphate synthase-associated protein 2 [Liparis tanakae]
MNWGHGLCLACGEAELWTEELEEEEDEVLVLVGVGGPSSDRTSCCCVIGGGFFLREPRPSELRCSSASRFTASISFFWLVHRLGLLQQMLLGFGRLGQDGGQKLQLHGNTNAHPPPLLWVFVSVCSSPPAMADASRIVSAAAKILHDHNYPLCSCFTEGLAFRLSANTDRSRGEAREVKTESGYFPLDAHLKGAMALFLARTPAFIHNTSGGAKCLLCGSKAEQCGEVLMQSTEGLSAAWVPRDPLPECTERSGRGPGDMNRTKDSLVIFTANSHPASRELAKRISERLGVELGKVQVYQETNRETRVQVQETSCARSITGVLPYFPYSKQCKMRKRGSIVSKLIASMMCKAGRWEDGGGVRVRNQGKVG